MINSFLLGVLQFSMEISISNAKIIIFEFPIHVSEILLKDGTVDSFCVTAERDNGPLKYIR